MKCLIDADVIRYEIGFAAEAAWKYKNEGMEEAWFFSNSPPWEFVEDMLERRIKEIEDKCGATESSTLYFTGKTNFRNAIAKRQPYKVRAGMKPYHFYNIEHYLKAWYDWKQQEGLEADDLISIDATVNPGTTIICTRDKDLRQVPGWHFGWELGKQPQFGPRMVSGYGDIELSEDRKKIKGTGEKFFLSQCLTGDTVDSIPGLPKCGPVAAYELLYGTKDYAEGFLAVLGAYTERFGLSGPEELLEQGRLLYMTRELNEDGSPKLWELYDT